MLFEIKEYIIILLIIGATSFFVLAEIAIVTSRRIKLQKIAKQGKQGAIKALSLKEQPEAFLSTVQVGITFMSISIGFYSGSEFSNVFADCIENIPIINVYSTEISNILVVLIFTYFTVLGEIIPKRVAMFYPEKCASLVAFIMIFFMKLFYPFIFLLSGSTKIFLKLLNLKDTSSELTTEEIKMIVTQAESEGTVDKTEVDMIKRLIHLSDIKVGTIMTPRKQMICLDLNDKEETNIQKLSNYPFNYLPVIEGNLNHLVGLVYLKRLLNAKLTNDLFRKYAENKEVIYIPEVARLTKLLELFREKQSKVAIVLDEYGEIEGIVTLNDILKTFVGDLVTQDKGELPSILKKKDGSFHVNGNVPIEEIKELLDLAFLPGEKEEDYRTISSFMLKQLNRMPQVGDIVEAQGYSFRISKMEKFRIDKVIIKPLK